MFKKDFKKYWNYYIVFGGLLILAGFAPVIFTGTWSYLKFNKDTGPIGDTIGGLTAPFMSLAGSILVFLALKEQIKANEIVNEQFQRQQIESRFFELLKLHRDNVAEIGIGEIYGRRIFVTLIREFRLIHSRLKIYNEQEKFGFKKENLIELSYLIFYFGFGPNSSRQLKKALNKYDANLFDFLENRFNSSSIKKDAKNERNLFYSPFEGHQSRLSHYFRHLYQTVDYINNRKEEIDKYSYLKALRAQLTAHEQALLYLNSKTQLGNKWWEKDYIIKYKIVKNIPEGFFDPINEIDIESDFPKEYFEYQ